MDSEEPEPSDASRRSRLVLLPLWILVGILVAHSLFLAREFFIPVTIALLLQFLLSPFVRTLGRMGVRPAAGAALVLVGFFATVGITVWFLWTPAVEWVEDLPRTLDRVGWKVRDLRRGVEKVQEAAKEVAELTSMEEGANTPVAVVSDGDPLSALLQKSGAFLASSIFALFLLYFMLSSYDVFLRKLVTVLPDWHDKRAVVQTLRSVENGISRYLVTVTLINLCLGIAIAGCLLALGMPNPFLWGAVAAFANFIPYVGALAGVTAVAIAAFLEFDDALRALPVPAAYVFLTTLEGMLITPAILGRRLAISPAALFAWLAFWSWMWGFPGAIVAVPMLVALKIAAENVPALRPLDELLG